MSRPIEELAPLIDNRIAWKMLATWKHVAHIRQKGPRRKAWARLTGVDELAIENAEPCVALFALDDGTIDKDAARYVRAMVAREVPTRREPAPEGGGA